MLLSLRDQQWRTSGIERGQDIVENQIIAPFIPRQLGIDLLDGHLGCFVTGRSPKPRLAKDDLVAEWPGRRLHDGLKADCGKVMGFINGHSTIFAITSDPMHPIESPVNSCGALRQLQKRSIPLNFFHTRASS